MSIQVSFKEIQCFVPSSLPCQRPSNYVYMCIHVLYAHHYNTCVSDLHTYMYICTCPSMRYYVVCMYLDHLTGGPGPTCTYMYMSSAFITNLEVCCYYHYLGIYISSQLYTVLNPLTKEKISNSFACSILYGCCTTLVPHARNQMFDRLQQKHPGKIVAYGI